MEWEKRWETAFDGPQDRLEEMARQALREDAAGETVEQGWDEL